MNTSIIKYQYQYQYQYITV